MLVMLIVLQGPLYLGKSNQFEFFSLHSFGVPFAPEKYHEIIWVQE